MEFPHIDDRISTRPHRHSFFDLMQPKLGIDFAAILPVLGGGNPLYNSIGHLDRETRSLEVYFPDPTHMVQEHIFMSRSENAAEGDGFVAVLVNNYATLSSELHVVATRKFDVAKAIVPLGLRLRAGLHGNWVDEKELYG